MAIDPIPPGYINPFRLGQTLPESPLFIEPGQHVRIPLGRSYTTVWKMDVLPFNKESLEG